jgi:hypothetical protein
MVKLVTSSGALRAFGKGILFPPLLFNIVGDALSEILNMAKRNGVITGLVPKLVEGG